MDASRRVVAALVVVAVATIGCSTRKWVQLKSTPGGPLAAVARLTQPPPQPSRRTRQLLRRADLPRYGERDPRELLIELQSRFAASPDLEQLYSLAEIAHLTARRKQAGNPDAALELHLAAVAHAYAYLFDPRFDGVRQPYDPQFRGAVELYNESLGAVLRALRRKGQFHPGVAVPARGPAGLEIQFVNRTRRWHDADFADFEFADDYDVVGLKNHYRGRGVGVPLIAIRKRHAGEQAAEKYLPPNLSFAVTALLRLEYSPATGRPQAIVELFDPLEVQAVVLNRQVAPLETDLSTPLAHFLNSPELNRLASVGLLNPRLLAAKGAHGLVMVEPFDPHKIPVVMIHGLWSSPLTWMEMYNDLRASPDLRDRYQFWFYMYPSGEPFLESAARLRRNLAELRATLDPMHRYGALDQSVLIGHSMGGLVARLQSVDSGGRFWGAVADGSFESLKGDPAKLAALHEKFFFAADPSVRRVVSIASPYGGSRFANGFTRWTARQLIALPDMLSALHREILSDNPEMLRGESSRLATSVDMLAPDSPVLAALRDVPAGPWASYHNIYGDLPGTTLIERIASEGDGVVSVASAQAPGAISNLAVPADHERVHRQPRAVLEVERILREHAAAVAAEIAGDAAPQTLLPLAPPEGLVPRLERRPPETLPAPAEVGPPTPAAVEALFSPPQ